MKYKILLALQLFFIGYIYATVKPSLAQAKDFAAKVSWAFEENKGQVTGKDSVQVKYFYKQGNLTMFLLNGGLAYQFEKTHYPEGYHQAMLKRNSHDYLLILDSLNKLIRRESYRMDIEFIGANLNYEIITEGKSTDYIQYYNHNALDVHAYQKIIYKNIYPNIDWVIYQSQDASSKLLEGSKNSQLETSNSQLVKYDFIVHPGGNPSDIKLKTLWTETTKINPDGSLSLTCSMGEIIENAPISFQGNSLIKTDFVSNGDYIQFKVDRYDPNRVLVIDPLVRVWGTYYGGSNLEYAFSCAVEPNSNGNIFLAGQTFSTTNIASGGHQNSHGGGTVDAFLVKFNPSGTRQWATYYGGSVYDYGYSCAADASGFVYFSGSTTSSSNIAFGGHQNSFGGNQDAFLVKFNSAGVRQWATYYGGTNLENGGSCNLDLSGNIYLTGGTGSSSGVASGGHQNVFGGGSFDGFLVKFNASGVRQWATYYGGGSNTDRTNDDAISSCAIDATGNVYVSGYTSSSAGIASGGYKDTLDGIGQYQYDAFLAKFNSAGVRQWATYYGGIYYDQGNFCTLDPSGNVYLIGQTASTVGIASGGHQNSYGGGNMDAFLVKFNASGVRQLATYYGGTGDDDVTSCSTDAAGNIYLSGETSSTSSIASGGIQNSYGGGALDCFLLKFNTSGVRQWATYYGGNADDNKASCAADQFGNIYLAGSTLSASSIAAGGYQNTYGGMSDGFLVKLRDSVCQPTSDTIYDSLCFNTGIWFNGANRFNPGNYFDTLVNAKGCDSFLTLKLFIRPKVSNTINQFICTGQSYLFNGILRTTSGTYFDTLMNNQGCDSFLTLNLSVKSSDTLHVFDTICETQSYLFNNQTVFNSGIYRDTFTSSQGCDSFVFLHLHVKDTSYYAFSHTTPCDPNASFMFNGLARTQSGIYSTKYLNALGCDSTAVLNLTVRKPTSFTIPTVTICPGSSYFFNGQPRISEGIYTQILTNSQGCDSTVTLNLKVLTNPATISNPIQGCTPFTFEGKVYTSSITFKDTFKSVQGCDSVFRTNILQLQPPATKAPDTNIIVCDSIRINNKLYTSSFSLIDTFRTLGSTQCDSVYRKTNYTIRYTPQIGLKERDTFMRGAQVTLRPFSASNYLWSTGETTKNLSFKLTEDRQLYLIAWNEEPCRDTANISLVAEDLAIVGMPTGFSPTGENSENRTLKPNINGRLEYFHMMVFNRWGEKVYETFETQPLGWNGNFKGKPAPSGLYGYVMEYKTLGSIFTKTGEVMLVW